MKKFFIFLLSVIALIGLCFLWFWNQTKVSKGEVEVFQGASAKQVAGILEKGGVIKNGDVFYAYVRLKQEYYRYVKKQPNGFSVAFKEGKFKIEKGNYTSLINQLNTEGFVRQPTVKVTIPEGYTLLQMAEVFEQKKLFSKDEFLLYVQGKDNYEKVKKTYTWLPPFNQSIYFPLEGYLQANTYHFSELSTPEMVVNDMLENTNKWYAQHRVQIDKIIADTSLNSFSEVITFASVVEKESKFPQDRPQVAQVFYNRLKTGMKLESDVTAAYGNQEQKVFMYHSDIQTVTPYNTYAVKGLPIGPIGSPSDQALQSAINPAGEAFAALYFYARPTGQTLYANTWEEHEQNRLTYEHEWKALEQ